MKDKKIIAYAFSDMHAEAWKSHNQNNYRLNHTIALLDKLISFDKPLIFCGDLIHNPNEIKNEVLFKLTASLSNLSQYFYGISGNHDMCHKNTIEKPSPSYLNSLELSFSKFRCIDMATHELNNKVVLHGIPYFNSDEDFITAVGLLKPIENKKNILLVHQNLPNTVEPDGYEVESTLPKKIYKYFKKFDLVLSGHIHKPQRVFNNTFMLGATNHQDFGDRNCKMGYYELYDDLTLKFIDSRLPEFKVYKDEPGDDYHLWVKEQEVEEGIEGKETFEAVGNVSRKFLAKKFCQETGVTDSLKVKRLIKALNNAD